MVNQFIRNTRADFILNPSLFADDAYVQQLLEKYQSERESRNHRLPTSVRLGPITPPKGSLYEAVYEGKIDVDIDIDIDNSDVKKQKTPESELLTATKKKRKSDTTNTRIVKQPTPSVQIYSTGASKRINHSTIVVGGSVAAFNLGGSGSSSSQKKVIELEHVQRFCLPQKCVIEDDVQKLKLIIPSKPKKIIIIPGKYSPPILTNDLVIYRRNKN